MQEVRRRGGRQAVRQPGGRRELSGAGNRVISECNGAGTRCEQPLPGGVRTRAVFEPVRSDAQRSVIGALGRLQSEFIPNLAVGRDLNGLCRHTMVRAQLIGQNGCAHRRDEQRGEAHAPQHFLYFFPLPQGHGSLRPAFLAETACFFSVPPLPPPANCSSALSLSFLRWMLRVKSSTPDWAVRR